MSFLISSQRSVERDALSEAFYVISDILKYDLKPLRSRVPGLSILRLIDKSSDTLEIMSKINEYIEEKGPLVACLKIVPMECLIKTDLPQIVFQVSKRAKIKILPSDSWRLTVNKRQSNLRTAQIINEVAEEINWGTVDLTNPDLEIRIEIIRDLTGISIMKPSSEISMAKYAMD
jgi:tRNA(Ser,Leu) C12 N-acetylase TAN1